MYIFLSHSSTNHEVAEELCQLLEAKGHQCFLAPRDIRSGYEYAEEIIDGIERADVMLLLLSEAANNSPHVLREIERAVSKKIKIVVYQLEKVELSKSMEYFLMTHQWVDTAQNAGYESIVACMEELVTGGQKTKPQGKKVQGEEKSTLKSILKNHRKLLIAVILIIFVAVIAEDMIRLGKNSESIGTEPGSVEAENSQTVSGNQPQNTPAPRASLGDTIVMGAYNGEPIEWRVLKSNGDGTAVVVSSQILTMKAFDAAEGGKYNYQDASYWTGDINAADTELQHLLRGNNQWSASNIRTWLNSEKENVTYNDQAPKATAMSELVNGYDMEPGFLHGFTEEELAAIVATMVTTGEDTCEDRVFLLSSEELIWFEEADVSRMAVPTAEAMEQDKTGWYQLFALDYNVEDYYWWLRDADTAEGARQCEAYVVTNSYSDGKLINRSVGLEGFGIRPAMTIDLAAECIKVKDGE